MHGLNARPTESKDENFHVSSPDTIGPVSYCGVTKKGKPCKNSVKVQDTKIGYQKLTTLSREPFDLSTLQSKLCNIARYKAAIRNQARVPHSSRVAAPSITHLGQPILTSVANIWAGIQSLTLKDLTLSDKVDDIYCVFCLTEDKDLTNECVILRCQCKALSHLACAEEWLEKRSTVFGTSCYICRNEGPLDASIRPLRVQSSDTETHHMRTASESSPEREPATITNSSLNDPSQSQSRQRSVGPQGRSVEQSVEDGPRRSARLGAHLPQGPSTSAPPRRSARLNSTRR
ncbi:hypothetical protein PROQFM164_S02g002985 [Penicillium roqueforti FM164]|uniref:Zinc finger, RING/FYVE/PHD-type n=1 Tax=Penicillium roqueforti (strain FM164) TaxID=1365484 RepID=W6QFC7_PENRF|nr:hypothetical protein PROQFM164_S02g002985 [Penicillium roqueforti FM164]